MTFQAFAATSAKSAFTEFEYEPNPLGEFEVELEIECCGVCHSDLHQAHNDWGFSTFPMVPGHEIIGKVVAKGSGSRHEIGQRMGVTPQVGHCGTCSSCNAGYEQLCSAMVQVYNSPTAAPQNVTYGGFSRSIRVPDDWAFLIPDGLDSIDAAPLLCAGLTTWSPLNRFNLKRGAKVGILGIGGLGHIALQFSHHLGYETVAISSSTDKNEEARKFGATEFLNSSDEAEFEKHANSFDMILCTVSANLDWGKYLGLIKPMGTFCQVGLPSQVQFSPVPLVMKNVSFAGSLLASRKEIQDMLNFSAVNGVKAQTETLDMSAENVDIAFKKLEKNLPRYRIVLKNTEFSG